MYTLRNTRLRKGAVLILSYTIKPRFIQSLVLPMPRDPEVKLMFHRIITYGGPLWPWMWTGPAGPAGCAGDPFLLLSSKPLGTIRTSYYWWSSKESAYLQSLLSIAFSCGQGKQQTNWRPELSGTHLTQAYYSIPIATNKYWCNWNRALCSLWLLDFSQGEHLDPETLFVPEPITPGFFLSFLFLFFSLIL